MRSRISYAVGPSLVLAGFVALWWAASTSGLISRVFLPTPQATFSSLVEGLNLGGHGDDQGQLLVFTMDTVRRMLLGWLLASLVGIVLGALIGVSAAARSWIQPMLEFVRPLPASALMPLAISLFGLSPTMVLFVVAFGSVWPVLLATVHGYASVSTRLGEVARCLQMSRLAFVVKIGLPNAMPDILAGMRLSMTVALIVAIVGEMIASQSGLGQAILMAARAYRADELFAGIALLGLIGFASNALLAMAERHLLRWQRLR